MCCVCRGSCACTGEVCSNPVNDAHGDHRVGEVGAEVVGGGLQLRAQGVALADGLDGLQGAHRGRQHLLVQLAPELMRAREDTTNDTTTRRHDT